MKIGVIIIARFNSSRLPGKALLEIGGRSVLGHIVDRLRKGSDSHPIVVATSDQQSDDPIIQFCRRSNIPFFRGSLQDVSERFINCAEFFNFDYAVRINGDNFFTDPQVLRSMIAIASTDVFDFITNVPGRTFPYGMSIEIFRTTFYKHFLESQSDTHREHISSWFYENLSVGKRFNFINSFCEEAKGLKLALDTPEDLNRIARIVDCMDSYSANYSLNELVKIALCEEHASPWIGNSGPLLIAEIGGNHEGNFELAKELTQQAISTGVDYIKFQLYRGDTLVSAYESPDRNAHFKAFELTPDQHIELAEICKAGNVGYMASVWDLEMLDWIDPYLSIYKIGSGDLTAWPIIREFARRGKPIILSTGLATLEEVLQTVSQIQAIDKRYCDRRWLCLLQCTSMYPIPSEAANLRVVDLLRQTTALSSGYSDHTEGSAALKAAAAIGAEVLEFHFTDSREGKEFRDHKVSLTADEVLELQDDLKEIRALRGSLFKLPQPIEIDQDHLTSFRRGTYLKRNLSAGDLICEEDIVYLRPNHGIDARDGEMLAKTYSPININLYEAIPKKRFKS
jgi:sialic acid synthase SpsE/spore coat polysaccharide biosynthesis protein SpsF (cytidylyltransferase family)